MNSKGKRTNISELGKYGLINRITGRLSIANGATIIGAGDDSAAIENGSDLTLATTDLLLEGIHFNLVYTPLRHLGYKSVIRGISDIYAMNGRPGQVFLSLGISSRFSVEEIDEFYEGALTACSVYGVDLAGGDTTSSLTGLIISVTAVGTADRDRIIRRSGAMPNDLICVSGNLGAAYMGLQLLERERKIFENSKGLQPELSGYEYIIRRQLKPEFPYRVLDELADEGITPSAMIDVSDGLASDLLHLCESSSAGCRIYHDKIPVDQETAKMAAEFDIDPIIPALNGGEDYELLFTIRLDDFEKIKKINSVRVIGHITKKEDGRRLVTETGDEAELTAQGWKP